MLEILYYIFIFPVEQLLDWALFTLFKATKNYGVSIILLSFVMQLFILKLTLYFDKKAFIFGFLKAQCDDKIKEFKRVFKGAELQSYIRTLYKQKHYHPIFALYGLGGLALQIPFFIAMIHLVENVDYLQNTSFLWITDLSKPDSIALFGLNVHVLPLLMTAFTLINVFYSTKEKGARIQGTLITLFFLVLLYDMPSSLVLYWTCNMLFALFKEILKNTRFMTKNTTLQQCATYDNTTLAKEYSKDNNKQLSKFYKLFFNIFTPYSTLDSKTYITYRDISILAIINICFLICVFTPYAVYSSDVSQFDVSQTYQTLGVLFGTFICSSLIIIYITSFFYKTRLFKFGVYVASILLLMGLINTFILTGDYGAMDHFVLQRTDFDNPALKTQKIIYALCVLIGSIIVVSLFLKKLKVVWGITFITLCIVSCIHIYTIAEANKTYKTPQTDISQNNGLQPYEKELFSYSKTDKNIVVMVLDMFSGSHMHAILEQFPEFKEKLDGFVLFDNAVSTTNSTIHSIATLISGEYYAVYNMNARKDNLADSITEAFGIMGDTFIKNGYDVSYFMGVSPKKSEYIQHYNKKLFVTQNWNLYLDYYLQQHPNDAIAFQLANEGSNAIYKRMLSVGVFRFSPDILRFKIYNNGQWLKHKIIDYNTKTSLPYTSSFYAFTHLHNTNAIKPTFKYLHSLMTHVPYGMYYNGKTCAFQSIQNGLMLKTAWNDYPHKEIMPYRNKEEQELYFKHYDSEVCALSYLTHFIEWLQQENIYDNTQIFIVSDHSGFDSIGIPSYIVAKEGRPDTLFLFKDFKTHGSLSIDSRLMANYDISSIFCENIPNGCPSVPKNILTNYPQNRQLIITTPIFGKHKKDEWLINHYFKVKGSIYDEANWQDITKEVKSGILKIDGIEH